MDVLDAATGRAHAPLATHVVTNQTPPLEDYDVYAADAALLAALSAAGADGHEGSLHAIGRRAGSPEAIQWGFEANAYPPQLRAFDRFGHRIDEVAYHPSYHRLLQTAVEFGLHARAWREAGSSAHTTRAAGFYVWTQVEAGHGCPVSMTHAAVPALRAQPELAATWEPLVFADTYDGRSRPAPLKRSALVGMAMTEKQGGSDVRANTTRATRNGDAYALAGHKWFCSAPMSDAFLVLAQAPGGLSCFLVPRFLPDGTKNAFALQRLKDKLGNRSNASGEVEFDGTLGWLVGEEGRGLRSILEMVNFTRLDCIIGSAAGMRQAVAQAVHHASHRSAFGSLLVDQPLMQNVLADLALESEAATLLFVRLARACDGASRGDAQEAALRRIGTALGKYWVCKRAAGHAAEALESLGGNGYVEESIAPRLYREAPLNSLWEGAGNVNALDVLRALEREPVVVEAYFAEIADVRGLDARLDAAVLALRRELADPGDAQRRARSIVERMALILQAALVVRASPAFVADAFCASRLAGDWGRCYGTLPRGASMTAIVDRARPVVR
ncbi:MAG: acyl-CoA dehydrogenase family protein [Candidatus Eremiobacteraeota bacterium]|nr:acyl-CoA dehydrogenase family protein [Candidatus Eremiobacteraeota bacterium]